MENKKKPWSERNKDRIKANYRKFYELNRERQIEYYRKYYQENKHRLKEKRCLTN